MITLTAGQLREILDFANPDGESDHEQLKTSVTIGFKDDLVDENGDMAPAGIYAWITEYPEEGAIGPLEKGE